MPRLISLCETAQPCMMMEQPIVQQCGDSSTIEDGSCHIYSDHHKRKRSDDIFRFNTAACRDVIIDYGFAPTTTNSHPPEMIILPSMHVSEDDQSDLEDDNFDQEDSSMDDDQEPLSLYDRFPKRLKSFSFSHYSLPSVQYDEEDVDDFENDDTSVYTPLMYPTYDAAFEQQMAEARMRLAYCIQQSVESRKEVLRQRCALNASRWQLGSHHNMDSTTTRRKLLDMMQGEEQQC